MRRHTVVKSSSLRHRAESPGVALERAEPGTSSDNPEKPTPSFDIASLKGFIVTDQKPWKTHFFSTFYLTFDIFYNCHLECTNLSMKSGCSLHILTSIKEGRQPRVVERSLGQTLGACFAANWSHSILGNPLHLSGP